MILILGWHQTPSNYDVILDHTHILFLSEEKNVVEKIAKPGIVPVSAGANIFCYSQEQQQ